MAVVETILADLLKKTAVSTAVNVISKRTVDPKVRLLMGGVRFYGLLETANEIEGAIRAAAFSDIGGIVASEIVVELVSKKLTDLVPESRAFNFMLQQQVEGYVLSPDFAALEPNDPYALQPTSRIGRKERILLERDWESSGGSLLAFTLDCIVRAVDAGLDVDLLLRNEECAQPRRARNWDRAENWLDRVNTHLGYALWIPEPTIGVGSGILHRSKYSGTFRRAEAEGYGEILFENGDRYRGQVRHGHPNGYGVWAFADGTMLIGHHREFDLSLGVSISRDRSKLVVGGHGRSGASGYARQIGLRDGVGSVSGFWTDGEITHPIELQADVDRRMAENWRTFGLGTPLGERMRDLRASLQAKALESGAEQSKHDQAIRDAIGNYL